MQIWLELCWTTHCLRGVNLQGVVGLSDEESGNVLNVAFSDLSSTLAQKGIRLESREAIWQSLKGACVGQKAPESRTYADDDEFHSLVLLNAKDKEPLWALDMSRVKWEPMALSFAEVAACV